MKNEEIKMTTEELKNFISNINDGVVVSINLIEEKKQDA